MKALVISPHPDDETLGCGGSIAALTNAGCDVFVMCVACHDFNTGPDGWARDANREAEFKEACGALGVTDCEVLLHPDVRDDLTASTSRIIYAIETGSRLSIDSISPDLVFLPVASSVHQDHRVVHAAALSACRLREPGRPRPLGILGYRGPDDLCFAYAEQMTLFIDTSQRQDSKHRALGSYKYQMKPYPHPRSFTAIEAIDRMNGLSNGVECAEVFTPYRLSLLIGSSGRSATSVVKPSSPVPGPPG